MRTATTKKLTLPEFKEIVTEYAYEVRTLLGDEESKSIDAACTISGLRCLVEDHIIAQACRWLEGEPTPGDIAFFPECALEYYLDLVRWTIGKYKAGSSWDERTRTRIAEPE